MPSNRLMWVYYTPTRLGETTQRSKIRLLKGHMPFGLHEFLPNPSAYVTILRNPIDRIISHYYYVIRHPNHHLYNKVKSNNLSLKDYVASGISIELDNFQMRSLAGVTDLGFGKCSSELLEQAKCHLQSHFAVVGLVERFDETLILMKRALRWHTPPFYTKLNVSRNRPLLEDIPRDTLDLIEKYNELDCELYEYTRKIFQQKIEEQEIEQELKVFRALNLAYSTYRKPYLALRHILGGIYRSLLKA